MKKLLTLLSLFSAGLLSSFFFVSANQSVQVTAVVGNMNHSPVVVSLSPSSNPKLLGQNKIQSYSLYFRDDEKDTVSYTITPGSGYVNPLNGAISSPEYDSASGAYIHFTYLSPASIPAPNPTTVTVTLNDGLNLVSKDIHLLIY